MIIEFGEWLPDKPDLGNPGCLEAKNCFPVESSYRPLSDLTILSSALTERPLGSFSAKSTDGNTHVFVGTASKLNKLQTAATWEDVSVAGGYTASDWDFTLYGDRIIAVNINDQLQSYVLGSSTDFANLVAIRATTVASSEEFVMIGNTYDGTDGNVPHRVRWCGIGDPTSWTVSASTQADYQDLNSDYGEVKKVIFADEFYVFQEKAITRLRYVGSPTVFNVDTFETDRGTKYPGSVASVGNLIFYLSEDGFYMLQHSQSVPIGADKVDKTFFSNLHGNYQDRIRASVDPINNLVIWAYPSTTGGGKLDKQLIFNWKNGKWSEADYSITHIGQTVSLGYTLEDLDSITTDLDALPFSLDSRAWQGGEFSLMMMNSDWKLCLLTGDTKAAVITTAEFQPSKNMQSFLQRITPLTDATATVTVGTRGAQSDSVTWSSSYSPETNGEIPLREKSRYFRVKLTTSGSFDHIQGIEINKFKQAGRR